jgi:hypothetical protein
MSLELLRERFGYSGVTKEADNKEKIHEKLSTRFTYKKDADNKEKIHEKLNAQFNDMGDIKSIKVQHQEQLDEKQRIIENFKIETSELANEIATLKKDKAVLLDNLNKSKWMEDKVHSTAKQIYEDKIKTMSYVDSTELIPLLISVSREKQGNTRLNWGNWLKISENKYLFQINESLAKRVFEDTNVLIDRAIGFINRKRTRGGDAVDKNYILTFAGDGGANDYVSTTFNPDNYDGTGTGLNYGFTVSYWVKPAEIGGYLRALGRRPETDGRFEFGLKSATDVHVGIGAGTKDDNTHNDGVEGGHGMEVGNWYHWMVTYGGDDHTDISGDRHVRIWINGKEIYKDGADSGTGNENGMGTANWQPNWTDTVNAASNLYFGARAAFQDLVTPYNQGWACSLSEVAIYNVEKDEDGTFANAVYNAGFGYDHRTNSNLVGYWRLNEGTGTRAEDLSGNGNHGTLTTEGTAIPSWTKNKSYE